MDLSKAFAEYYKTKGAQSQLKENADKAKEQLADRFATLKKLADDIEKIKKEAQDPVLSESIRAKKRSEFESKAQEIRSLERDINEFRQLREQQLQTEGMQQRKGLYEEILKVVNDKAKADQYDLVFDKSGMGAMGLPFLIHAKEGTTQDFTAEVIVELNKDAPAGGAAAPAAEEKPAAAPTKPSTKKK
ncbi:OmpH family outer membrane protein [Verrucomicrobium spinosum]|uniref:OmpH family outer membrane protein n=1 Tax=Verrucomicrobium spinosum TaxID=2736 RepID=UPI00155DB5B2|nr:OmpH family outer membrane protein [Verrucomicrobium spinosum]